MSRDGKTKDIFFGIVAIATLIVAIIGATLAYFSITASSNEGAINATSAVVSIEYNDGKQVTAQADELIPSSFEIVQQVYENQIKDLTYIEDQPATSNLCLDANYKQVCSAYRFTVASDLRRTITGTLNNEHNGFTYLSYALYDWTTKEWFSLGKDGDDDIYFLPLNKCTNTNENTDDDCYTNTGKKEYNSLSAVHSIFGHEYEGDFLVNKGVAIEEEQVFDLILFIAENGENQNIDQGQQYSGTIIIDVSTNEENGQITGKVD